MRIPLLPLLALAVLSPAAPAPAQPATERLAGEVMFGGATLVDPPPGEPTGTHAYVTLTGAAARRLFEGMPGPATQDACEPGWRSRTAGSLRCSIGRRAGDARCSFSIIMARGAIGAGGPC